MLALLTLAAGCNSNDPFRNYAGAVGPDLYTKQTVRNTSLLNAYTSSICAQAGLYTTASGGCTLSTPADWKTFVDMGLYDIDQRCDTFLDGLYYKEKSTGPILAQISNTRSFTGAVLEATKTSNVAIWIVAAAFDLTEATFRNSRMSLLEALDPTTVKSIVFRRQQDVKKEIYRSTISSKPQALHALRTYLRVCMPFTIEMEANAILTTVQRTDGDIGRSPIVFNATIPDSRAPVRPGPVGTPANVQEISGGRNFTETEITLAVGQRMQRMLCATASDGNFASPDFRARLLEFDTGNKMGTGQTPDDVIDGRREATLLKQAADRLGTCGSKHLSAFEAGYLFNARNPFRDTNTRLQCILTKSPDSTVSAAAAQLSIDELSKKTFTEQHRIAYSLASKHFSLPNGNQLTPDLVTKIFTDLSCL